jgi:hypothetical protein
LSDITGSPFESVPFPAIVHDPPRGEALLYAWRKQFRSASWPQ